MNKTPADRLKELRLRRYLRAKEAADAFGWNEVTYRSHESGMRNIPLATARRYAAAFGSTVGHILGLEGGAVSSAIDPIVLVPLVAVASAGAFRDDDGLDAEGASVPAVPCPDIPAGVQYSVKIVDRSVNKRIPDGAFAICAPLECFPGGAQHGQLVHVVRERAGLYEHTIKELHFTKAGMALTAASSDQRYGEPIILGADEDGKPIKIQGIVIGAFIVM